MADAFYPFVGEGPTGISDPQNAPVQASGEPCSLGEVVTNPARIAVFDDPTASPRVVVIQPSDVRTFLEEITATVTKLAKEQGGSISFTVIREVVENYVHAYFIEPTITILNGGNTIRFSDQGPGIREKDRALEYGTTSATEEMKRYIRGVGSGLPYAQQYMEDHGGTLTIEDNMNAGTVVTISMPTPHAAEVAASQQQGNEVWQAPQQDFQQMPQQAQVPRPYAQQASANPYQASPQALPQQMGYPQPGYQQPWQQQAQPYPSGTYQPMTQPGYTQPYYQQPAYQQPWPQQAQPYQAAAWQPAYQQADPHDLNERESQVIAYLAEHESVGPTDLVNTYGGSLSTWTRQLQSLEGRGYLLKDKQKRRLTEAGRALLG
ncbi:ATP-binding protein [Parolsenella catena]|uniref:ATP-binding protein n=1 Tax=Parolsenella catena TaxID=2003188 RepID=UPI00189AE9DA|nr:ATP-binding protein [Parolsenella catena]